MLLQLLFPLSNLLIGHFLSSCGKFPEDLMSFLLMANSGLLHGAMSTITQNCSPRKRQALLALPPLL